MTEREKIIKELELIRDYDPMFRVHHDDVFKGYAEDALDFLKAMEPRVMTIDEIGTWVMIDRVNRAPIVVEVRDRFTTWIVSDEYFDLPECDLSSEFYGKTWRCWNTKPSKEDMEAEPWDD